MIFGAHIGVPEKEGFEPSIMHSDHRMWCHSPESWTELWNGLVFEKGVVKVQTKSEKSRDFQSQLATSRVAGNLHSGGVGRSHGTPCYGTVSTGEICFY